MPRARWQRSVSDGGSPTPTKAAEIWTGERGSSGSDPESDPEEPPFLETQTPGPGAWGNETSDPSGPPQTQAHTAPRILGLQA